MEESHGKQDSCQERQDHLGHVREGGSQHSFPRRGRKDRTNHSALGFSVSVLAQLHLPKGTHTPWASTARSCTPRLWRSQAAAPAWCCLESSTAPTAPGHSCLGVRALKREAFFLSCPAAPKGLSNVSSVWCKGTGTLRVQ